MKTVHHASSNQADSRQTDVRMAQLHAERIQNLEMLVGEMDAHIQSLQAVMIMTAAKDAEGQEPVEVDPKKAMRDTVWACQNCGARLGIYNEDKDELRVRYKDFVAYITPGVGGKTMVPCRRCGERNTLEDER